MQIGSALEAVKKNIIDLVARNWDSVYSGLNAKYPIEPRHKTFNELTINTLHYPVKADWVYFNSTIEKSSVAEALEWFVPKKVRIQ